ncbi:hypothetical protein [Nocardioides terrisoli]|uniref:hypothetical protein n=1 Tax=Nocardioides terrisoli TaxID=3388267 RepID=UPI00287BBFCA|nr:hypothetical protein [Nocardioides marmorisolisilvae]
MDGLKMAWSISLIVTVIALPMGLVRLLALHSGGFEPSRTMQIAARFALGLGAAGLFCLGTLSVVLLMR